LVTAWICLLTGQIAPPHYLLESFVNAAQSTAGMAPGTIASVFGTNLSFETRSVTASDLRNGRLPTRLGSTGVTISVGGLPASLLYISPSQINFVVPTELRPANFEIVISRQNLAGPRIRVPVTEFAPALFEFPPGWAIVSRPDGSLVTKSNPIQPGEWVTLWANGLGPVNPPLQSGEIPADGRPLRIPDLFKILIDDVELEKSQIGYAGTAPGLAAVYQINLRWPSATSKDPVLRIGMLDRTSPATTRVASAQTPTDPLMGYFLR
jgi:uncharacterized protein (TIGR03437 family)